MNPIAYPPPYTPAQGQLNQVIRRPMTDAEMQLPGGFYRGLQNSLRGLSLFCLVLFVFNSYILPVMITDAVTYDSLSIVLMIFMAVFGLVSIGMSINTIVVRGKIKQVMMDGSAVEVFAPAYRAGAMRKGQGWTVGPISVLPTRGIDGLLVEGMPTRILCLPRLKAAIAINNVSLKRGARITCPPNLDAMAVPVTQPSTFDPNQATSQAPPAQMSYPEDLPPPPPPID